MSLPYPPPFQDLRTLAQHVGMCEDTIEKLVKEGRFPEPRRNKCAKRLWVWKEVEAHLSKPDDETPADEAARIQATVKRLSHG